MRILRRHGFVEIEQVIVAHHRGRILPIGTMRSIIEGSGSAMLEWLK
jgi:hypothetical protein